MTASDSDRRPAGAERERLAAGTLDQPSDWKAIGAYVSERAWGTVREDYSADGNAWEYFTYEDARSRAYRWSEDGLAGICDRNQKLCFALAVWNGHDPFIKERMFGLTNGEGNHGEDVKEYYWYADATPTASWLSWLYHYPQAAFPYARLREENAKRSRKEREFELCDTGIFDDGRYWKIGVDYAKESPFDLCIRIRIRNVGPEAAKLVVLPTLWYRNRWSWDIGAPAAGDRRGRIADRDAAFATATDEIRRALAACRRPRSERRSARAALLRERNECRAPVRRRAANSLPEGWNQRPRRVGSADSQSRDGGGRRWRASTSSKLAPARRSSSD